MSIGRLLTGISIGLLIIAIAYCGWAGDGKSESHPPGKLRKPEGQDNAVTHYQRAAEIVPEEYTDYPHTLLREVRLDGWSEEAEALLPYFQQWKPALDEIRRGTRVGYARNVSYRVPIFFAVPNFLQHLIAANMLAAEGRYLESKGEYAKALENYLTGVKLGRDFTQPEASHSHHTSGIGMAEVSIRPLYDLVEARDLDNQQLQKVIRELAQAENTWGPIAGAFALDESITRTLLKRGRDLYEDPEEDYPQDKYWDLFEDALKDTDRLIAEVRRLHEFETRYAETPYWRIDRDKYNSERENLLSTSCPYIRETYSFSPGIEIVIGQTRLLSQLRATGLAAAVELYRLDHDAAPRTLEQLVPEYLESIPIDPFTGKSMRYRPWTDEGGGAIYSLGPDREDDRMKIEYDGTNGTMSGGDVFLR